MKSTFKSYIKELDCVTYTLINFPMFHLLGPASVQALYYELYETQKKKILFSLMELVPVKTNSACPVYILVILA